MPKNSFEDGVVHLIPLLSIFVIAFLFVSSQISITRNYFDGRSKVLGVTMVKGEDLASDVKLATSSTQVALVQKSAGALSKFPISI